MISLGATRIFRCRNKKTLEKYDIEVKNGQLLAMCGNFQKEFTHEVPIQKTVRDERISLTFRRHSK